MKLCFKSQREAELRGRIPKLELGNEAYMKKLPDFIEPMLCKPGEPFDSDEHLFEVKWDGTRVLAFIDDEGYRLVNRNKVSLKERYPEFEFLAQAPAGIVIDGEIVVLKEGKPDFGRLMSREQARTDLRVRTLAKKMPAVYIAFDLLYLSHTSIMNRPLEERREGLAELVKLINQPKYLILSQGIEGQGTAYFDEVVKQKLEGVIAKKLTSKYEPGRRTGAWTKIKRGDELMCAIIGFVPDGKDFRSLILAAEVDGVIRYVGKVGTGLTDAQHKELNTTMHARLMPKPAVPCPIKGKWVEPGLFCKVSFLELSENGELRMPVFEELRIES